jgi:hypothetical protein
MNDLQTIDFVVTERAYQVVLDRVKQLRDSHKGTAKAGDLAKYYGVPVAMIKQIFAMIQDRRAIEELPNFQITYK